MKKKRRSFEQRLDDSGLKGDERARYLPLARKLDALARRQGGDPEAVALAVAEVTAAVAELNAAIDGSESKPS